MEMRKVSRECGTRVDRKRKKQITKMESMWHEEYW